MTGIGTRHPKAAAAGLFAALVLLGTAQATQILAETVNLRPEIAKSMCLEFEPAARIADCNASSAQSITLTRRDTAAGERIMRVGQSCIEAGAEGAPLFLAACRNVRNQTWSYTGAGQIQNGNGLCIDVAGAGKAAHTPAIAYRCTGAPNQRWARYDPAEAVAAQAGSTKATLRPDLAPAKCLDLTSAGKLVLWTCHGGANQSFTFATRGSARISVNGKCLEPAKAGHAQVRGAACDVNRAEQLWTLEDTGKITNRTGGCMDLAASGTADGTEILRWDCNGGRNQKFRPH